MNLLTSDWKGLSWFFSFCTPLVRFYKITWSIKTINYLGWCYSGFQLLECFLGLVPQCNNLVPKSTFILTSNRDLGTRLTHPSYPASSFPSTSGRLMSDPGTFWFENIGLLVELRMPSIHMHDQRKTKELLGIFRRFLLSFVQRVDNTIHRINHYPVDNVVCFDNTYPLDSDLSVA